MSACRQALAKALAETLMASTCYQLSLQGRVFKAKSTATKLPKLPVALMPVS